MAEHLPVYKNIVWDAIKNCTKQTIESYENGIPIISPIFDVPVGSNITKWCLAFYPNGNKPEYASHFDLFIRRKDQLELSFNIKFTLKIIGKSGKHVEELKDHSSEDFKKNSQGVVKLLSHEKCFDMADDFFLEGNLKIGCKIKITPTKPSSPVQQQPIGPSVSEDVLKMFEDEFFADFELKFEGGETLKCHKFILAARSPVCQKMLSSNMKEARQGFVEVSDFSFEEMKEVLRYIYCGSVEKLDKLASHLIFAGEKYDLVGLKEICIKEIIKNLSEENVLQALLIADRISGCEKLIKECVKLIGGNFFELCNAGAWKNLSNDMMLKVMNQLVLSKIIEHI